MLRLCAIVCMLVACTQAQRLFFGNCPNVDLQEDFKLADYMGTWYEYQRYFAIFEFLQDCVTAEYAMQGPGTVSVRNRGYNVFTRSPSVATGDAIQTDPRENPAKLGVKLGGAPARGDYWVVSTDYTSYTIVWSCTKIPLIPFNTQFAWVLTRDPNPDKATVDKFEAILKAKGLKDRFRETNQKKCPGRA